MSSSDAHPILFGRLRRKSPYSLYKHLQTAIVKYSTKDADLESANAYGKLHNLNFNLSSRDSLKGADRSLVDSIELQRITKELYVLLSYYKSDFTSNLLEFPANNSNDEQKLMNDLIEIRGVKQTLAPQFKQFVNELSKKLNLSQVVCLDLVLSAQESYPNQFQIDPERTSISLYFEERQNILLTLLGLIQSKRSDLPKELSSLMNSFVFDIVKDSLPETGLINQIVKKIKEHNQNLENIINSESLIKQDSQLVFIHLLKENYLSEREKLAECLFYILNDFIVSTESVVKIFDLLYQSLNILKQLNPENDAVVYIASEKIVYTLLLAIVSALDPYKIKIGKNEELTTSDYNYDISRIDDEVKKISHNIQGLLSLVLSLCYEKSNQRSLASEKFDNALDSNVFRWVSEELLQTPSIFEEDEILSSFSVKILSELSSSIILNLNWKLEDIRSLQIKSIRQRSQIQSRYQLATEQFMNFISSIFLVNSQHAYQFLERCFVFISRDMPAYFSDLSIPSEGIHTQSFISYTKLLSSLSNNSYCAREIFTLLKDSISTTFEWNGFFNVLRHFRFQTQVAQSEASHLIVESILELISNVCDNFPVIKPLFFQNSQWEVMDSLFGFFGHPNVSNVLMGKVFKTISSLIFDQNIAMIVWNRLEYQQVLVTQNRSQLNGGIRYQFSKFESQERNYPETIGFLKLLSVLFKYPAPLDLGLESRVDIPPGVGPYLDFVQKTVFNYFEAREYNLESQKWEMVSLCLTIFFDILSKYKIHPSDFTLHPINIRSGSGSGALQIRSDFREPLPGFQLLLSLLKLDDQLTLKGLLKIICKCGVKPHAENRYILQQNERFQSQGSVFLEKSILLSMRILIYALEMQDEFRALGVSTSRLEHVKLRTSDSLVRGEDLLKISGYISYPHLIDIRFYSIKLLSLGSKLCQNIIDIFINYQKQNILMNKLISRLRGDGFDSMYTISNITDDDVRNAVLDLLLINVDSPIPNLTHFLCGFENKWSPNGTKISIRIDDSHCLFTILQQLNDPLVQRESPFFVQKCYQLIYRLCLDKNSCISLLQFLESTSFFNLHLLRQNNELLLQQPLKNSIPLLHQRGFIFKIFTLLIYISTTFQSDSSNLYSDNQLGTVQNLIRELFQDSRSNDSFYRTEQSRILILELLDAIKLTAIEMPPPIQFQRFPGFSVEEFIEERPIDSINISLPSIPSIPLDSSKMTIKNYDIVSLHSALLEAKYLHQRNQSVDSASLDREIKQGLELATKWNQYYQTFGGVCNAFFGWKNLVEVAISKCYSMLTEEKRDKIIYTLIITLANKLVSEETSPKITIGLSSVILKLTSKLREQNVHSVAYFRIPMDQSLNILRSLITAILHDEYTPATRGNLYASLLYYLQYTKVSDYSLPYYKSKLQNSRQTTELFHDFEKQQDTFLKNHIILDEKYQQLIDKIGKDALIQRGAWKTTAFSTLDLLFSYDINGKWVKHLEGNQNVSLGSIVQQFTTLEPQILSILQEQETSLNAVYILESIASFLVRVCKRKYLRDDTLYRILLSVCDHCQFLDWIPFKVFTNNSDIMEDIDSNTTSKRSVFHQILIPIFQILATTLTEDPENIKIAQYILKFIVRYKKSFSTILKQTKNDLTKLALQEQRLVTSIFHLLFTNHHNLVWNELKEFYPRIEKLFKSLLIELLTIYNEEFHIASIQKIDIDAEESILEICRNIIGTLRSMTQFNDEFNVYSPSQILFTVENKNHSSSEYSLNVLVNTINTFTNLLQRCDEKIRENEDQLSRLSSLGIHDLRHILESESNLQGLGPLANIQQSKQYIQLVIQSIINQKSAILSDRVVKILFILENSLLILWLHLNYFLSQNDKDSYLDSSISKQLSQLILQKDQRPLSVLLTKDQRFNFIRSLNSGLRTSLDKLIDYQLAHKLHSQSHSSEFLSLMAYNISTKIYQANE